MKRAEKKRGVDAFHEYYGVIYGERWKSLSAALLAVAEKVPFQSAPGSEAYFLDSASLWAASALRLPDPLPGRVVRILDACAAPGGKSLVIAARLARFGYPEPPRLVANELSSDRRRRLAAVLDQHLPTTIRSFVDVTAHDAAALCRRMPDSFDAIFLDAPCSSERHVIADAAALAEWTPARSRNLAVRQWSLLSSAFLMLKTGGCLVYATCSLSPLENDGVASRLAAKYGGAFEYDSPGGFPSGPGADLSEPCEFGSAILPDRAGGAGPMYVCRIRKA